MRRGKKSVFLVVVFLGVMFLTAPTVWGTLGYTSVGSPPLGELSRREILSDIYDGTFIADGYNYIGTGASEGITALRVYDFDDKQIKLYLLSDNLDSMVDQIWTDGIATVTAEAKYAHNTQSFGWNEGGLGTTYHPLLTHNDIGQPGIVIGIVGDFLWGYHPDDMQWWSMESKNSDYKDHLITYKIDGLGGPETVWLIFMEDNRLSYWKDEQGNDCYGGDNDYNDFVVEVKAVPEPATMLLLGIGGIVLLRRRK